MEIKEKFIQGKKEDFSLCEDALYISDDFIAVIDGVTGKSGKTYGSLTGGKAAAMAVEKALDKLPRDAESELCVEMLTKAVASVYNDNDYGDAAASVIVYSDYRKEVWSIGDCQCIINNELFLHEKEIDRINSEMRSLVIACEKEKGSTTEQLLKNDIGRKAIMPVLETQHTFANNQGKFSYGIINGSVVPNCHIVVHKVKIGDEIILSSDGYPYLKNTLDESEKLLKDELEKNPLCCEGYISTKGLVEGNISFDDRTYIRFKV